MVFLPVKELDGAKARLAGLLTPEERPELVLAMLADVTAAALGTGLRPQVLSPDAEVLRTAEELGAIGLREAAGADSLNTALSAAIASRAADCDSVLIVLPDVPLVQARDFVAMLGAGQAPAAPDRGVVLWPDRARRGTNALLIRPPGTLAPSFGEDSFARHLAAADAAGVAARVRRFSRIALDVDTEDDLRELLARSSGQQTRTGRFLRSIGIEERLRRRG
jgi:2-phospho-L-lactate guanylyltransferase